MGPTVETQPSQPQEPPKVEKKLTREQRRIMERVNREAHQQLSNLVNRFYESFMENDPDSDEVTERQKEVSTKWKMYCHHRQLKKEALSMCDDRCNELRVQYKAIKEEQK